MKSLDWLDKQKGIGKNKQYLFGLSTCWPSKAFTFCFRKKLKLKADFECWRPNYINKTFTTVSIQNGLLKYAIWVSVRGWGQRDWWFLNEQFFLILWSCHEKCMGLYIALEETAALCGFLISLDIYAVHAFTEIDKLQETFLTNAHIHV